MEESTITGTVGEVVGRTVNTSRGSATVFDVTIGSQKASTFKSDIAEQANALKGSTVEATVGVRQNGQYTNYTLLGIKLVDAAGTPQAASSIPVAPAAEKKGWSDEDTARVTKLSCFSTAFQYAGQAGLSEDEAVELAGRLYGRAMGKQPEPVAAGVAPTETDDGIPW